MGANPPLQVAVGIIKNAAGEVLLSYRHEHLHQGNLWEFPGGKFKAGETAEQALERELHEELNITVAKAMPTLVVQHQYPDKAVQLHVWTVTQFSGIVRSSEGQAIKWVKPEALSDYEFPAANQPIITAARLPAYYAILGGESVAEIETNLVRMLEHGIGLIQFRSKNLKSSELLPLLTIIYPRCQAAGAKLLLNSDVRQWVEFDCDGVHLTSRHLMKLKQKPDVTGWVAASCHTRDELLYAQAMGVDFAVLAPVNKTSSHPDARPLGWPAFASLVAAVNIPVYALGGMQLRDLSRANQSGAQGIAGISAFEAV